MKRLITVLMLLILVFCFSCSSEYVSTKNKNNVAFIGDCEDFDEFKEIPNAVFSSTITSDTDTVIVGEVDFVENANILSSFYENGGIIVIVNETDIAHLYELLKEYDFVKPNQWSQSVLEHDEDIKAVGFCNRETYCLNKPLYNISGGKYVSEREVLLPLKFSEYIKPLIDWINNIYEKKQSSFKGLNDEKEFNPVSEEVKYNYRCTNTLNKEVCYGSGLGSDDKLNLILPVEVLYSYYPVYAYEGQNGNGDYYLVHATYRCMAGTGYQDNGRSQAHGAYYNHYRGPFMRNFNVETWVDGASNLKFISGHTPTPATGIEAKSYSSTDSFKFGFGVSLGLKGKTDSSGGGNFGVNASFEWGWSQTISYTISDLGIENHSDGSHVKYDFVYRNLPKSHFTEFEGDTPLVAKSTGDFDSTWIWYDESTKDSDTKSLGTLKTKIKPKMGVVRYYSGNLGHEDYEYEFDEWTDEGAPLKVPNRVAFGGIRVENDFDDGIIKNINVKSSNGTIVASSGSSSYRVGKTFDVYVPIGENYIIEFDYKNDSGTTKRKSDEGINVKKENTNKNPVTISARYDTIKNN